MEANMKKDIHKMSVTELILYIQNLRRMIHTLQETIKKLTP